MDCQARFMKGFTVHRRLDGPNLQKVFDTHSKSNLLLMWSEKALHAQSRLDYDLRSFVLTLIYRNAKETPPDPRAVKLCLGLGEDGKLIFNRLENRAEFQLMVLDFRQQ